MRLLDLLAAAMRLSKDGADAQTQLEVALVKAAAPEVDPSTRALLARMERMESALRGAAPVAAAAPVAPPFGLLLYVMLGIAPKGTTLFEVASAALPFLLCDVVLIVILVAFPSIALFLPSFM